MMSAHYEDNAPSLLKHKLHQNKPSIVEYTKPHLCKHNSKHSCHSLQHHHHPITTAVATKFCSNAFPCTVPLLRFVYTTVCCMIQLASGDCLYYHKCICEDSSQFPPVTNFCWWVFMLKYLPWLQFSKLYEYFVWQSHLCQILLATMLLLAGSS